MAKALLSSSLLPALPRGAGAARSLLPPLRLRRGGGRRRAAACAVRAGLHGLDSLAGLPHLQAALERAEAALYTLADAAVVAADSAAAGGGGGGGGDAGEAAAAAVQKNGGWFGFISEALEVVLKASQQLIEWPISAHITVADASLPLSPPPSAPSPPSSLPAVPRHHDAQSVHLQE